MDTGGKRDDVRLWTATLERRLLLQLVIGVLLSLNNGACFCWGLYSPFLKDGEAFAFTQSDLNAIATIGTLLSYFSLPTGLLYDRCGPRWTLAVGTTMNCLGWAGLYLLFRSPPLLQRTVVMVGIAFGLTQLSASYYETSCMLTNLRALSCYPGRVVLIQKTFMGLGSALVAQLYYAVLEGSSRSMEHLVGTLLLYSATVGVLGAWWLRLPDPSRRCLGLNVADGLTVAHGGGEPSMFRRPFRVGTVLVLVCVSLVLSLALVEELVDVPRWLRRVLGGILVLLPLSLISMVVVCPSYEANRHGFVAPPTAAREEAEEEGRAHPDVGQDLGLAKELPPGHDVYFTPIVEEGGIWVESIPATSPSSPGVMGSATALHERSLWENLQHRELWMLWFVCFACWGAMTLISTNCAQIYESLAPATFSLATNAVYLSIYGVAGASGRILVGLLLPVLERRQLHLSLFFVVAPLLNVFGLPLFLLFPAALLGLPFFAVGLATGVSWGSCVLLVTSLFSPSSCGMHYSWLYTAGMASPIVFNWMLFGPTYDHHSRAQGLEAERRCEGRACIAAPLLVCLAVNAAAAMTGYALFRRFSRHADPNER